MIKWILSCFKPSPVESKMPRVWASTEAIRFEFIKRRLSILKDGRLTAPVKREACRLLDAKEAQELANYYKATGETPAAIQKTEEEMKMIEEVNTRYNQLIGLNEHCMAAVWRDGGR